MILLAALLPVAASNGGRDGGPPRRRLEGAASSVPVAGEPLPRLRAVGPASCQSNQCYNPYFLACFHETSAECNKKLYDLDGPVDWTSVEPTGAPSVRPTERPAAAEETETEESSHPLLVGLDGLPDGWQGADGTLVDRVRSSALSFVSRSLPVCIAGWDVAAEIIDVKAVEGRLPGRSPDSTVLFDVRLNAESGLSEIISKKVVDCVKSERDGLVPRLREIAPAVFADVSVEAESFDWDDVMTLGPTSLAPTTSPEVEAVAVAEEVTEKATPVEAAAVPEEVAESPSTGPAPMPVVEEGGATMPWWAWLVVALSNSLLLLCGGYLYRATRRSGDKSTGGRLARSVSQRFSVSGFGQWSPDPAAFGRDGRLARRVSQRFVARGRRKGRAEEKKRAADEERGEEKPRTKKKKRKDDAGEEAHDLVAATVKKKKRKDRDTCSLPTVVDDWDDVPTTEDVREDDGAMNRVMSSLVNSVGVSRAMSSLLMSTNFVSQRFRDDGAEESPAEEPSDEQRRAGDEEEGGESAAGPTDGQEDDGGNVAPSSRREDRSGPRSLVRKSVALIRRWLSRSGASDEKGTPSAFNRDGDGDGGEDGAREASKDKTEGGALTTKACDEEDNCCSAGDLLSTLVNLELEESEMPSGKPNCLAAVFEESERKKARKSKDRKSKKDKMKRSSSQRRRARERKDSLQSSSAEHTGVAGREPMDSSTPDSSHHGSQLFAAEHNEPVELPSAACEDTPGESRQDRKSRRKGRRSRTSSADTDHDGSLSATTNDAEPPQATKPERRRRSSDSAETKKERKKSRERRRRRSRLSTSDMDSDTELVQNDSHRAMAESELSATDSETPQAPKPVRRRRKSDYNKTDKERLGKSKADKERRKGSIDNDETELLQKDLHHSAVDQDLMEASNGKKSKKSKRKRKNREISSLST
ncbi:hypothetical protein THAOC_29124 [Thalassiosira oceanica]|uniref:Uncharacterized protein n=1 Tax=Thalassiosira oceanica TaxID=159749 RepID=K0RYJ7_THAOC|nr:hypothetical protein THAOC_29124 [Thalassiosira oceanica]|eukprot:EJK51682.1 hypothetical protein THAOC_29124 [Thalassiosira oceanica]